MEKVLQIRYDGDRSLNSCNDRSQEVCEETGHRSSRTVVDSTATADGIRYLREIIQEFKIFSACCN
jgi:hypothetical protein